MSDGVGAVLPGGGDEMLGDQRPGQRRDKGVLAFVLGVGFEGGHHEVLGVLVPAVVDHGLDRPGRQRPLSYRIPVAPLAHVGGQGDDLDAHLLSQPAHGDRRVEAAAVRKNHSLRRHTYRPASSLNLRATLAPSIPSGATTSTVSSPATVPSTSGSPARSMAEPTTCAD